MWHVGQNQVVWWSVSIAAFAWQFRETSRWLVSLPALIFRDKLTFVVCLAFKVTTQHLEPFWRATTRKLCVCRCVQNLAWSSVEPKVCPIIELKLLSQHFKTTFYSDFCVVALAEGPCLVHTITGDLLRALEAPELFQRPRVIAVSSEGHCIICYESGRFCNFSINGKLLAQMEVNDSTRVRWQHTKRDGPKPFVRLLASL